MHYLDLKLLPDPDFATTQLQSALFAKLHMTLVEMNSNDVGVSFPHYHAKGLGDTVRLHGSESSLHTLLGGDRLKPMLGHLAPCMVRSVPAQHGWQSVRRIQAKSSPERLRRRLMQRHNITEAEALQRLPDSIAETIKLPFLVMKSLSTQTELSANRFKLFIEQKAVKEAQTGAFNTYGLSTQATVPLF